MLTPATQGASDNSANIDFTGRAATTLTLQPVDLSNEAGHLFAARLQLTGCWYQVAPAATVLRTGAAEQMTPTKAVHGTSAFLGGAAASRYPTKVGGPGSEEQFDKCFLLGILGPNYFFKHLHCASQMQHLCHPPIPR